MSIENSDQQSVRVRITGRVQGVCFRAWAQDNAKALGLDGWVRNRRDGAVEALFSGPASQVFEMLARCRKGPPAAFVADVAIIEDGATVPPGFRVLPTA
jgi:acylphosphatase